MSLMKNEVLVFSEDLSFVNQWLLNTDTVSATYEDNGWIAKTFIAKLHSEEVSLDDIAVYALVEEKVASFNKKLTNISGFFDEPPMQIPVGVFILDGSHKNTLTQFLNIKKQLTTFKKEFPFSPAICVGINWNKDSIEYGYIEATLRNEYQFADFVFIVKYFAKPFDLFNPVLMTQFNPNKRLGLHHYREARTRFKAYFETDKTNVTLADGKMMHRGDKLIQNLETLEQTLYHNRNLTPLQKAQAIACFNDQCHKDLGNDMTQKAKELLLALIISALIGVVIGIAVGAIVGIPLGFASGALVGGLVGYFVANLVCIGASATSLASIGLHRFFNPSPEIAAVNDLVSAIPKV